MGITDKFKMLGTRFETPKTPLIPTAERCAQMLDERSQAYATLDGRVRYATMQKPEHWRELGEVLIRQYNLAGEVALALRDAYADIQAKSFLKGKPGYQPNNRFAKLALACYSSKLHEEQCRNIFEDFVSLSKAYSSFGNKQVITDELNKSMQGKGEYIWDAVILGRKTAAPEEAKPQATPQESSVLEEKIERAEALMLPGEERNSGELPAEPFLMARALYEKGNYKEAFRVLQGMIDVYAGTRSLPEPPSKDCSRTFYLAGMCAKNLNETGLARLYLLRAIGWDPKNAEAKRELVQILTS